MARTIGMAAKIIKAIIMADHFPYIDKIEAPKYAYTKAYEI